MKKSKLVSYIFPVYNEEKYLGKQIEQFISEISSKHLPLDEILLVENGSNDKSWQVVKDLEKKYSFIKSRRINFPSYGQAVKHGMLSSNCNYLFVLNVDFYDINFIKNSFIQLKKFNVVSGSKLHRDSSDSRPYLEQLRTRLLSFVLIKIFNYSGTDTHGIKAFRRTEKLINTLQSMSSKNELFDTELLIKLKNEVTELPISIKEIRPTRYTSFARIKRTSIDISRLIFFFLFKPESSKIIVADDYGMSATINTAIINQLKANTITHVSVLPNMTSIRDLKNLKSSTANKNIIAHINLLRGKPLSEKRLITSIIDKNGNFLSLPVFLIKLILKHIKKSEIEYEIINQIIHFQKNDININEINSEQHLHFFEPINSIIIDVANKNNIKVIRNNKSIKNYLKPRLHKYLVLHIFSFILNLIYKERLYNDNERLETIVHPGSIYD